MTAQIESIHDADGVAILRIARAPFGPALLQALEAHLVRSLADTRTTGVVLASSEENFIDEIDVSWLREAAQGSGEALEIFVSRAAALAALIDASNKPFAAAIAGNAHGTALELALACHRRFGAQQAGYSVGFTNLRFGLPPMLGTAPRLASRIGSAAALKLLRNGAALTPVAAWKAGLIDELKPESTVVAEAARWITLAAAQRAQKPAETVIAATVNPASPATYEAASRLFVDVARGPVAQDMMRTLGCGVAAANRLASRPAGYLTRTFRRVGVLGAGLMGSGIALVCARAGMSVTMVDMSDEAAQRGLAALAKQEASGVATGRLDATESQTVLSRIAPTARYEDLNGVDIVVEAVFEDREVKARATRKAEAAIDSYALFATNTSTLPITGLAEASTQPGRFIGLHFFSPVPRMPLLEIIRGKCTSDETLAHAMDFARAIGKTPIIINDARGFYTTRVVMAYQAEAFDMLAEGADPEVVEAGGNASGMPVPPLALSDAVALDLIHQINLQAAHDLGAAYTFTRGYEMVGRMVEHEGRKGKKTGCGFYDYAPDGSKVLWPRLRQFAGEGRSVDMSVADARDRLLAAQALETVRCLDEGVITNPSQCDVGAILGWGFSPSTGGPLSWIDRMGVAQCVARCKGLFEHYGSVRLKPLPSLQRLAACGGSIYATRWPLR